MDFSLTQEQEERVAAVETFAREVLSPGAREREAQKRFDRALWDRAGDFGLAGLPIPDDWGGSGLRALDVMLLVEALGKGCADGGLVFSLCAHMFACAVPIWRHGSQAQKERYLRDVAAGTSIACNAITEPGSGSDVHAMATTAERDGSEYVLNGTKCFSTNATVADLFVIYARTDRNRGYFGISAFLVPRDAAGLTVREGDGKSGLSTSPWGDVYLEGCRVHEDERLGSEGAGASIFADSMIWERGCLFAAYVGAMERALEAALEHAKLRTQFDHPIGHFQSVANRLVDMKLRLETSRLLLYRAGWLHDQGRRADAEVAECKLWISECAVQSGLDAIQLFGAAGVMPATGVDTLLRDALPARIFSGSSEMQRMIIARHMGLR